MKKMFAATAALFLLTGCGMDPEMQRRLGDGGAFLLFDDAGNHYSMMHYQNEHYIVRPIPRNAQEAGQ